LSFRNSKSGFRIIGGNGIDSYLSASEPLFVGFCLRAPADFGGKGIRTPDFQLAKLALYQLSYAPAEEWRMSPGKPQLQAERSAFDRKDS
jgi:hypothetical protein